MGNVVLPVINGYHYSADVIIALVLAFLVYSNPAISIAVYRWTQIAEAVAEPPSPVSPGLDNSGHPMDVSFGESLASYNSRGSEVPLLRSGADDKHGHPPEVGSILVPFYGVPLCNLDGVYYVRTGPAQLGLDESGAGLRRAQAAHFVAARERLNKLRHQKEEILRHERMDAQTRAAKNSEAAQERFKHALAVQAKSLEAEERQLIEEMQQKLGLQALPSEVDAAGQNSHDIIDD